MENSAPSLKIFHTKFSTSALYNGRNKNRRQNPVREVTKTIIPFALVGYEVIITNSRYALVGYFVTSYPTRAHGIIVIYFFACNPKRDLPRLNIMAFCPAHPKGNQNPKFIPLSEATSIPAPFICDPPPVGVLPVSFVSSCPCNPCLRRVCRKESLF